MSKVASEVNSINACTDKEYLLERFNKASKWFSMQDDKYIQEVENKSTWVVYKAIINRLNELYKTT